MLHEKRKIYLELIYIYAFISAVMVIYSSWVLIKIKIKEEKIRADKKNNWWVFVVFEFVGVLGLLSTLPGIFFNDPYWLLNKVFSMFT